MHRYTNSDEDNSGLPVGPPPNKRYPKINFDLSAPPGIGNSNLYAPAFNGPPSPGSQHSSQNSLPVGPPPVRYSSAPVWDSQSSQYHRTQRLQHPSGGSWDVSSTYSTLSVPSNPPVYGQYSQPQFVPERPQYSIPIHGAPRQPAPSPPVRQDPIWTPPPPAVSAQQSLGTRKKAIIIGCNYKGTNYQLQGCIRDAKNVEYMLITRFGFKKENIVLLTDDGLNRALPTKTNIFNYMNWLITGCQSGDSLFFHFSGHGSQKPDFTGDERDGLNETLLPCDFKHAGQIIDDEINERLINPLPKGVYLHAIIDACHSGTAMDLEYYTVLKNGSFFWRSEGPTRKYKGTAGGIAVLFSACEDSQVAQDTDNLSGFYTGAATHAFIEAVEQNGALLSYSQILSHMHSTMDKLAGTPANKNQQGLGGKLLDKLAQGLLNLMGMPKQSPQISCNIQLNLNEVIHI